MPKAAIAPHHTRTSDNDWDGPAAEARLPDGATPRTLRREFAYADPDANPETKEAYKFPHHEVSANGSIGAANERACISGIAILNGARGGADVPASQREAIYRHLAAHLKDAGREPPALDARG
jgi:uncharacterized protein